METNDSMSTGRRILGLAMIAVGIFCSLAQFEKGHTLRVDFGQGLAYAATTQTGVEMPRIENATLETRAVTGTLDSTMRELAAKAEKPEWIAYGVDQVSGKERVCCGNYGGDGNCGTCRLENDHNWTSGMRNDNNEAGGTIKLEGARQVVVLYRLEANKVMRIRLASQECTLDVGGLPFIWLTGVKATESVALLETYVHGADFQSHGDHGIGHGALSAIAMHADASADRAFESFVKPERPEELRRQAAFWLGAARGKSGLDTLLHMAKTDPSSDVRAHVTFALSVSHEPGAIDEMIRMAHDDTSTHVRGQALFWLAQKAGKKAVGTITGAIENDPDTDVKKKAVFALSQLPKDEGVPKLIEVAQTNRNPEVRKQAMFWLGQSNDPRALQFFEKVLSK
jgi:HEAT repeat protein